MEYQKYLFEKFEKELSPVVDIYGNGEEFNIVDNQDLYEMVKIIKDYIDKHFYASNFKYNYAVDYNKLIFQVENEKKNQQSSMFHYLIADDMVNMIQNRIQRQYNRMYSVSKEVYDLDEDNEIIKIIISKKV